MLPQSHEARGDHATWVEVTAAHGEASSNVTTRRLMINDTAVYCFEAVKFTMEFCSFSGRGSLLSASSSSSSSVSPKAGITLDLIRDLQGRPSIVRASPAVISQFGIAKVLSNLKEQLNLAMSLKTGTQFSFFTLTQLLYNSIAPFCKNKDTRSFWIKSLHLKNDIKSILIYSEEATLQTDSHGYSQ